MPVESHHSFIKTLILFFGFLVFTTVFGTLLCGMWYSQLTLQSVLSEGFQTDALLEHKYMDEQSVFWFTYRFTTISDDTYRSSIDVSEALYHQYDTGTLLPMHYLADNPEFNALDILADDIQAGSRPMLYLSLFVTGVILLLAFIWVRDISLPNLSRLWQAIKH